MEFKKNLIRILLGLCIGLASSMVSSLAVAKSAVAIFAGGCFWSTQHDFEKIQGVQSIKVGYTGGTLPNPSYNQVSGGNTGHYEAIKVTFDPKKISYGQLLDIYWHDIDPTDAGGQFCDQGSEYRTAIFYGDGVQKKIALRSMKKLIQTKRFNKIYTLVLPAQVFYPAEEYHQDYAAKNPAAYAAYREGCRRDDTLKELWSGLDERIG